MPRSGLIPIILMLILVFFFILFFFNIVAISFIKLGLTPEQTFLIFLGIIIGSYINIPVFSRRITVADKEEPPSPFFYYPPRTEEQVIYINVGGAVIPAGLSFYFLQLAPLIPSIIGILVITLISKLLARPVPGEGISMPVFIPPIASAIIALVLAPNNPAPVAYISGVLGTLIGADLLNLGRIKELGAPAVSIGGAGVFDGIFLIGIIAALLT